MKYTVPIAIFMAFAFTAYSKPTAPETPDVSSYERIIKPDRNVPAEHQ